MRVRVYVCMYAYWFQQWDEGQRYSADEITFAVGPEFQDWTPV